MSWVFVLFLAQKLNVRNVDVKTNENHVFYLAMMNLETDAAISEMQAYCKTLVFTYLET